MTKFQLKIIYGQILGDAHIEKIKTNCRISFSFGTQFHEYAIWIYILILPYCSNAVYSVIVKAKDKSYTNYRFKTKTLEIFTTIHDLFYKYEKGKYHKVVPNIIRYEICNIVLAHFIMGDGNYSPDGRVRIYTNNYTFEECILLKESIKINCNIECKVIFDRISSNNNKKQYILIFSKIEVSKLQFIVKPYIHKSILYRVGLGLSPILI